MIIEPSGFTFRVSRSDTNYTIATYNAPSQYAERYDIVEFKIPNSLIVIHGVRDGLMLLLCEIHNSARMMGIDDGQAMVQRQLKDVIGI